MFTNKANEHSLVQLERPPRALERIQSFWIHVLTRENHWVSKGVFSAAATLVAFGLTWLVFKHTEYYFPSIVIVSVMFISAYSGTLAGLVSAVFLAFLGDYYFLEPIGQLFANLTSFVHFAIVMTLASFVCLLTSSLRSTLRAALQTKDQLAEERTSMEKVLAFVSHDVRNPLNNISMSLDLLKDDVPEGSDSDGVLTLCQRNVGRINDMVETLLTATHLRAGHALAVEMKSCDLASALRHEFEQECPSAGRIRLEIDGQMSGRWGVREIQRAITNLLTNAKNYGAHERPIRFRIERTKDFARLSVWNEGPPIPVDQQKRLFQAFHRAESSKGVQGWGLGLAYVKAVAEAHGGHVQVESSAESGTTFTMVMPIRA